MIEFFRLIMNWKSAYFWILLIFSCVQSLYCDWSMPPEIISPSLNATTPYIASDRSGNSVAVWYIITDDVLGTGTLQGARLVSGAVNGLGQPAWILTNPIAVNVLVPTDNSPLSLGMDAVGNAVVAWIDNSNNVFISRMPAGQSNWSSSLVVNTQLPSEDVGFPFVSTAQNGNTVILWSSSPSVGQYHVLANVYDEANNLWKGQQDLFGGSTVDSPTNQVAINSQGNAVAVLSATFSGLQAVAYDFGLNSWSVIPAIPPPDFIHASVAIDAFGNALFVWIDFNDNSVHTATLPFGQALFTQQSVLSFSAAFGASLPKIQAASNGSALVVWPEISGSLASARYASENWILNSNLNLGNIPTKIALSLDAQGNAIASWTTLEALTSSIQTAFLSANQNIWTLLTQISANGSNQNSQLALTVNGDAVAIWENDINPNELSGTINSSIFISIIHPLPPSEFLASAIKNKFLSQTDYIHRLTWQASLDPSIIYYQLYRNGVLLAQIPANGFFYQYDDHKRKRKEVDIYTLIGITATGLMSLPVTAVIETR